MKQKQLLSSKQFALIKAFYVLCILLFVTAIIGAIYDIILFGISFTVKLPVDSTAVSFNYWSLAENIIFSSTLSILAFQIFHNANANRARSISISYIAFAIATILSFTSIGVTSFSLLDVLSIISNISSTVLAILLFRKINCNRAARSVFVNVFFIADIAGITIKIIMNPPTQSFVVIIVGLILLLPLSIIPYLSLKDAGFYKYFIEAHPKSLKPKTKYYY